MTPTPLATLLVAPVAGAIADRRSPAALLVSGALVTCLGATWLATRVQTSPDFIGAWLPGTVLIGAGLGLAYATFAGVTVSALEARVFGLGSGLSAMTRQIGSVLGVACFVAILGQPSAADALAAFDRAWTFAGIVALLGVIPSVALLRHPSAQSATTAAPEPSGYASALAQEKGIA
jgi:MFS family permease